MSKGKRLAAIMFTDIVGYTALMGSDEDRAFKILHINRDIHLELIDRFAGKLIKEMGDGMLISFHLAADAVFCAIEIQKQARAKLDAKVRIGIHLGDITFENEDVFGDGVNLASRIQSIADPGGIYISDSIQKSIRSKSDIQTKLLGEFNLKNVDYPVRTYAVQGEDLPIPTNAKINKLKGKGLKERIFGSAISYTVFVLLLITGVWWGRSQFFGDQSKSNSLVVLPVDNYTGSDSLDYYMAGVHSSLINGIGKISSLRVPSKTTANAYKNAGKSMKEISSELNVNYIIEPSVSCFGDSICLQINLITIYPEEKQIWFGDYYVEKSQILNWYNKVAKDISEQINVILTPEEETLLAATRTVDPEAYDAFLKGQYYWEKLDQQSMQKALEYFQLAIDIDPEWADPYAGLANAWGLLGTFFGVLPKSVTLPKVYDYLGKALELDPNSAQAHYVNALNAVWTEFDWAKGEKEFLTSLKLNPNDALCRMYYAHLLMILKRSDEAAIQANLGLDLDPMKPLILGLYGVVMRNDGDHKSAIHYFEKALSIDPNFGFARGNLFSIQMDSAYTNRDYKKWIELWVEKVDGNWFDEARAAVLNAFNEKGHIAAIEEMLKMNEKYGNKGSRMINTLKAERYLMLNNVDKAVDCLEMDYEMRDMDITYVATNLRNYDQLKTHPRYIGLLKKMNLPLP